MDQLMEYIESRLEQWRDMAAADIRTGSDPRTQLIVAAELQRLVDYGRQLQRDPWAALIFQAFAWDDPVPANWRG